MKGKGRRRELDTLSILRDDNWVAVRLAWGCADIVAMRFDETTRLIQVKATAGGPYEHFGPVDRQALIEMADMAGAEAWLAWWPPRRGVIVPNWLSAEDWPPVRVFAVSA